MTHRTKARRRPGSVLPMVAVCTIALFGFVALAVDLGMVMVARNQCQNAADAAAMAGARTINGDASSNYNYDEIPKNAFKAATDNYVLSEKVQGDFDPNWQTTDPAKWAAVHPTDYTYRSGQVEVNVGTYAYAYNDSSAAAEGFQTKVPREDQNEPYSAVQVKVTYTGQKAFGRVWNINPFTAEARATAVHRPRDVVIIMDLSGSMRFQSLPGTAVDGSGKAMPSASNYPRVKSMNPEAVYPLFGHYNDEATAALRGTASIATTTNEYCDPCNISAAADSGPPILDDFYQNAAGVAPSSANKAFSRAPDTYATAPGGDNYLKDGLDAGTNYAKTVREFNNASTVTNAAFEGKGYASVSGRTWNGYTQGPGYWGKTFWVWPPAPPGPNVQAPPASLTDTAYASWHNNGSRDWRQRFFVAVNTATNAPTWLSHNTILFEDPAANVPGTQHILKKPGNSGASTTTVTENGVQVTYKYYINYAAVLHWLRTTGTNPFPSTLQAGRIRYYTAIPDPSTDNGFNNRWWTTNPSSLPANEAFWKEYIDFVLGFYATGTNAYNRYNSGVPIPSLIGNGDYFQWSGSTLRVTQRPQPQPPAGDPGGPYQQGTVSQPAGHTSGATTIQVAGLAAAPVADRDWVIIDNNWNTPYLAKAGSTQTSLVISPGLDGNAGFNKSVKVFNKYMDYDDCPYRPRHQFWFGPMTFADWLGNYNTGKWWWPGNVHEAHSWACKVGIQTAIDDIKKNHPNDFIGMTFFSSPCYDNSGSGQHNKAVVPLGRSYSKLKDSLWFPPTTINGTATEITPWDTDMAQVPRAKGGTSPAMGFMIAYNLFSSSSTNLRAYAQPQPQYRGSAGGLGRKGAARMIIFETDGAPNTRSVATLAGSGADSYYPIRVKNPEDLTDSANVEWPSGGTYANQDVYDIVTQVCALTSASPPGYSTARKPVTVHAIAYGSLFDPANAGTTQTNALNFLQQVQYIGSTQSSPSTALPNYKKIYGPNSDRIAKIKDAFTAIMQSGVQVSLIE